MQAWLTPPNLLTYARIALTPVAAWQIILGNHSVAFWIVFAAGLSDGVDGFLARTFHWQTRLGAYLDPLADKFLLVSLFLALTIAGFAPFWLLALVLGRDLWILAMVSYAWFATDIRDFPPRLLGKASTTAQILCAGTLLVRNAFPSIAPPALVPALIWLVALLAVASGLDYTTAALLRYRKWRKSRRIDATGGQV